MSLMNGTQFSGVGDQYTNGDPTPQLQSQPQQQSGGGQYGAYQRDAMAGKVVKSAYGKLSGSGAEAVTPEAGAASFEASVAAAPPLVEGGATAAASAGTTAAVGGGEAAAGAGAGAVGGAALGAGAVAAGAGLAGYGIARVAGADKRTSEGAGIGTALGTLAMPGVGSVAGGVVGGALGKLSEQFF
jgi:hypothetical protein